MFEEAESNEEIIRTIEEEFIIKEAVPGESSFIVEPKHTSEASFNAVFSELRKMNVYPLYRKTEKGLVLKIVKGKEKKRGLSRLAHVILILATAVTITWAGYVWWANRDFKNSILFAAAAMLILGSHELGHALVARRNRIEATLPFFIPVPPVFPFGTLGAVIFINSPTPDRKALFDVGIAGPLTGFFVSLPILFAGILLSKYVPFDATVHGQGFLLGTQPLFELFAKLILGEAKDMAIDAHPLAIAGWFGLFVTTLNLFPIGQLDGGHVIRSLAPRRYKTVYFIAVFLLIILSRLWQGWFFWAILSIFLTKLEHPGPLNDVTELDAGRKIAALFILLIFALSFTPVPVVTLIDSIF